MTRIGIVGLGPMGALHLVIFNSLPGVRIVGVAESDRRILRMAPKVLPDVVFCESVSDLLSISNLDALVVCTPAQTHHDIALKALSDHRLRGIFVEKPLCTNFSDAQRLTDLAHRSRVITAVGFQKRFLGTFSRLRTAIGAGSIGRPVVIRGHHFSNGVLGTASGWKFESGSGGALLEWGVHLLDLLVWTFGEPLEISGRRRAFFSTQVEDYASIALVFASGVTASVEIGWSMRNFNPSELLLEVHGSEGVLSATEDRLMAIMPRPHADVIPAGASLTHVSRLNSGVPFLMGPQETVLQDMAFLSALKGEPTELATFTDASRVNRLIDLARARFALT